MWKTRKRRKSRVYAPTTAAAAAVSFFLEFHTVFILLSVLFCVSSLFSYYLFIIFFFIYTPRIHRYILYCAHAVLVVNRTFMLIVCVCMCFVVDFIYRVHKRRRTTIGDAESAALVVGVVVDVASESPFADAPRPDVPANSRFGASRRALSGDAINWCFLPFSLCTFGVGPKYLGLGHTIGTRSYNRRSMKNYRKPSYIPVVLTLPHRLSMNGMWGKST